MLGAVFVEGDVDLAGAEDYAVDLVMREDGIVVMSGVGYDPLEVRLAGEVFDGGACERVAEEGFGEEEDQSWRGVISSLARGGNLGYTYVS